MQSCCGAAHGRAGLRTGSGEGVAARARLGVGHGAVRGRPGGGAEPRPAGPGHAVRAAARRRRALPRRRLGAELLARSQPASVTVSSWTNGRHAASRCSAPAACSARVALRRLEGRRGRRAGGPAAVASGAVSCVLTPELTEGPFYLAGEKMRRDITDGHPGTPLHASPHRRRRATRASRSRAPRSTSGTPTRRGVYSGFGSGAASRTFMRGIQRTDAQRARHLHDGLPGLVPGPRGAHPREGARRRATSSTPASSSSRTR